jgi:hypothetical protein
MTLKLLFAGAAMAASLAGFAAHAGTTVIGQESDASGFVGNLLEGPFPGTQYIVASDGETAFDPFGAGFDTSDGLNFSAVGFTWNQAADSTWTSLGNQTWVLPATTPGCGSENSNTCEPVGHFVSPSGWSALAIGTWDILESDGSLSDVIITSNNIDGSADLKFFSDPSLPVPEPATWAMMLVGLFGLGAAMRSRRQLASATA